jgi:gluconolactonase
MGADSAVKNEISRRDVIAKIGAAAGAAVFVPRGARGQQAAQVPARTAPPSVISSPPRDFSPGATPVSYPDPDILTIDPAFTSLRLGNTPIQRLWTGGLWCEGPAWSSEGRYLVWSDIPNNRQMRYLEDDGRVTVFRYPSNNSNGNAFDHQGRQLSCEHAGPSHQRPPVHNR